MSIHTSFKTWETKNVIKLSRSLSGVEAILLASAPLSRRSILPGISCIVYAARPLASKMPSKSGVLK